MTTTTTTKATQCPHTGLWHTETGDYRLVEPINYARFINPITGCEDSTGPVPAGTILDRVSTDPTDPQDDFSAFADMPWGYYLIRFHEVPITDPPLPEEMARLEPRP